MSSNLSMSITVSAMVGGALAGLTSISKTMNNLELATEHLRHTQADLGRVLDRNKERLGVSSARVLWQEYDKLGDSIKRLQQRYIQLQHIQGQKLANQAGWQNLKSQWVGAVAAGATLVAPVKLAIDFESAMADVKKVVNFDTPQQFKEMNQDVLHLTRSIPMAANEIAAIVASGGQAGVARENLIGFATDAAKMGVAFDMAAGDAGTAMATMSNVLGIPIPKIGLLGDAINHLSDNANSKAADIVNVLTRVGSDTKQLGLTENQAAALGSTFLSFGKAPELAAQAIKGITSSLSVLKAGGGEKELAQLGMTTQDFARAMNQDAQGAISNLLTKIKQLPKDQQYPLLMRMFGKQYADDVLLLANGVGEYNRQLDLLSEKDASGNLKYAGSMQREFENRSATTANQIQLLKNGLAELGITVGSVVLPAVNDFVGVALRLSHYLTDLAENHPQLTKAIIGTVAALLSLKVGGFAAMVIANRSKASWLALKGGFLSVKASASLLTTVLRGGMGLEDMPGRLGKLMRGLAAARTAMMGLSLSSLVAMWPIALAVGAIAVAALLIYKYWKPIKAFFAGLWNGLMQGLAPLKPLFDGVANALSSIWTTVQPYLQPVIDFFADFFSISQVAEGGARSFGESVGLWIGEKISAVVNWVVGRVEELKTAFNGGLTGILALIINWSPLGAFYQAFSAVMSWFGITLPATFTGFGQMLLDGLINGIRSRVAAVVEMVGSVAARIKNAFTSSKSMDIHSPSRVFTRFGGYIMEGLHLGLNRAAPRPIAAIGQVATDLQQRFTNRAGTLSADMAARLQANSAELAAARQAQASASLQQGMTIHFNPTINAGGDVGQIQTALQMTLREFEDLLNRAMAERERRAF